MEERRTEAGFKRVAGQDDARSVGLRGNGALADDPAGPGKRMKAATAPGL